MSPTPEAKIRRYVIAAGQFQVALENQRLAQDNVTASLAEGVGLITSVMSPTPGAEIRRHVIAVAQFLAALETQRLAQDNVTASLAEVTTTAKGMMELPNPGNWALTVRGQIIRVKRDGETFEVYRAGPAN